VRREIVEVLRGGTVKSRSTAHQIRAAIPEHVLEKNGGDDETRTRDLWRDNYRVTSTFNDIEEHGRHCKSLEVHHRQRYCVSRCISRRPPGVTRGQSVSSGLPVIGQNPDQTPRGPECYYLFATITAELVSFTLVAEDEVAIETLAVLSRRRIPTKLHLRGGHSGTLPPLSLEARREGFSVLSNRRYSSAAFCHPTYTWFSPNRSRMGSRLGYWLHAVSSFRCTRF
jgi:hypothetical protein